MDTCSLGGIKGRKTGKCSLPSPDDGLVVQCVGDWAKDKHDYLVRYIEATRRVRSKWLPPLGTGGAAFIDLFGGPGICCVRGARPARTDGSPLIALKHTAAPFTKVIVCELDHENVLALRQRTSGFGDTVKIIEGDCNAVIDDIVAEIPPNGLNVALIDPFAASSLHFESTIKKLARFRWMDLIIHWPTMDLKRNFDRNQEVLEQVLGVDAEEARVLSPEDVTEKIRMLKKQLEPHGYLIDEDVRTPAVTNSRHGILYHLVYVSKNKKGNSIWNSIVRREPSGQGNLF